MSEAARAPRDYVEYAPAPPLRPWVECFWTRAAPSAGPGLAHRVLPDGCLDVVTMLDADAPAAFVVGAMTAPLVVPPGSGAPYVGVRFRPGCAPALLATAAAELTDLRVPLEALWQDGAAVRDRVAEAADLRSAAARLEQALLARLARAAPPPLDLLGGVRLLAEGGWTVEAAAARLGVTRQHLARRFAMHVGLGPKAFARVMRLQRTLGALARIRGAGGPVRWAALAADLGYADQAHLTAEFRALTGLTPRAWLGRRAAASAPVPNLQDPGAGSAEIRAS